jgi:hypothetical protein
LSRDRLQVLIVSGRFELTDAEYARITPLLPDMTQ